MRDEILKALQTEYAQLREQNEEDHQARIRDAKAHCPELENLLSGREELIYGALQGILRKTQKPVDLSQRMAEMNAKIRQTLVDAGLPEDMLEPKYRCDICEDKGYTGEPIREMCSCMRKRFHEKIRESIGLKTDGRETFDSYDDSLFSDEKLPGKTYSQRSLTATVRDLCKQWAETYPKGEARNILLMGQTGLGKSFMMHAMAERLVSRDVPVLMVSAWRFLEIARKSMFGDGDDEMNEMLETEVLLIDDLGSEPMMKNITVEQLFNIINERQNSGKATIISTNLTKSEFRERYTERIASRMMDARQSLVLTLMGDDLRRKG